MVACNLSLPCLPGQGIVSHTGGVGFEWFICTIHYSLDLSTARYERIPKFGDNIYNFEDNMGLWIQNILDVLKYTLLTYSNIHDYDLYFSKTSATFRTS